MSIRQDLALQAELAGRRYLSMVEAWRGVFSRAIASSDFGSAKAAGRVGEELYDIARTFIAAEQVLLESARDEIALGARRDALRDASAAASADAAVERTRELLGAPLAHALREIAVQIERDIALVLKKLRAAALEVDLAARAQRIAFQAALIQFRARGGGELRFYHHDRAAKRWPSQKFIRSVVRGALLDTYNQAVMATLAELGLDQAVIDHPDPNHAFDGAVISLLPGADLPTYEDVREEAFHPNSEAVLARPEED